MAKTKASTKTKASAKAASSPVRRTTVTRTTTVTQKTKPALISTIAGRLNSDLSMGSLFAELVGTFGLVAVVLSTNGNPIVAGFAVLLFVVAFGRLSGAHINPAVTIALLTTRKISPIRAGGYVIAQILGAMLALVVISQFVSGAAPMQNPYTGEMQAAQVFTVPPLNGDWRPFFAEMLGAIIFGLGVAAATFSKRDGLESGFLLGGSLMLGLLLATQASSAILNPAVALGLDAYKFASSQDWWTLAVYGLAPILGVTAGVWGYKLFQYDVKEAGEKA